MSWSEHTFTLIEGYLQAQEEALASNRQLLDACWAYMLGSCWHYMHPGSPELWVIPARLPAEPFLQPFQSPFPEAKS